MPNELAAFIRAEIALIDKAKKLGLSRTYDPETMRLMLERAAGEIERLSGDQFVPLDQLAE
ncbi:MAG: hypothetical protein KGL39_20110 [Patescibacteria group bacterium]|nr:hypothetical protein [Patescibacteria group bacterium]